MSDKSKNISFRLSHDDVARLEARAAAEQRTVSQLCRLIVLAALNSDPDLAAALAEAMKRTRADSPAAAVRALLDLAG